MRITRGQLRQIIHEELTREGRRSDKKAAEAAAEMKRQEEAELERMEALVSEKPDIRALGMKQVNKDETGNVTSNMAMLSDAAKNRATQALAKKLGVTRISARQIDAGFGADPKAKSGTSWYSVVEKQ